MFILTFYCFDRYQQLISVFNIMFQYLEEETRMQLLSYWKILQLWLAF